MEEQFTKRPQNWCHSCGYSWYPRGKDRSLNCPKCGDEDVEVELQDLSNFEDHWDGMTLFTAFVVVPFLSFFGTLYLVYLAATGIASLGAQ